MGIGVTADVRRTDKTAETGGQQRIDGGTGEGAMARHQRPIGFPVRRMGSVAVTVAR